MENEHTPGPWHAYDRGIGWEIHPGVGCLEQFCAPINTGAMGSLLFDIENSGCLSSESFAAVAPLIAHYDAVQPGWRTE